jgi:membrane-bound metal-dependent hydrolase YbcI (DUF457 family)
MPFTPYHFGPSGFIGLAFRKWIDIPVFVLSNVIVDVEVLIMVLLDVRYPIHRYTHTLLLGTVAGIIWVLVAWPLRNVFKKIMRLLRIPYKTSIWKMLVSGILGVWLHVIIDSIYHPDVRLFWPNRRIRVLYKLLTKSQVKAICIIFLIAALILYILAVIQSWSAMEAEKNTMKLRK